MSTGRAIRSEPSIEEGASVRLDRPYSCNSKCWSQACESLEILNYVFGPVGFSEASFSGSDIQPTKQGVIQGWSRGRRGIPNVNNGGLH